MGKTPTSATGEPRQRGFTLIELLVVLAILVGLSAAFPLAWQRLSPQRQVQIYARRLESDLRLLRAQAMQGNAPAELSVMDAAHAYRLSPEGTTRELPAAITLRLLAPVSAQQQEPAALRFYPDGSSSGGEFVLEREGRKAMLAVSALTGRVTAQ